MATEKTLKTRVKMKHGKESEWALATKFTPLIGEIIVYDVDNNHTSPRFKVGDGLTNVNNLKFVNQDELAKITTLGDELLAVKNGYLPKTGGTLSGNLVLSEVSATIQKNSSVERGFVINNTNNSAMVNLTMSASKRGIYSSSSSGDGYWVMSSPLNTNSWEFAGIASKSKVLSNLSLASSSSTSTGYWNPYTWTITSPWDGYSGIFAITTNESNAFSGIFSVKVRASQIGVLGVSELKWLSASSTPPELSLSIVETSGTSLVARLYIKVPGTYLSYILSKIQSQYIGTETTSVAIVSSIIGTVKHTAKTVFLPSLSLGSALPIANGGTGSTTASGALSNLGGLAKAGGTMSGALTLKSTLAVNNSTQYTSIQFMPSFATDTRMPGVIYFDAGGTAGYGASGVRFQFRQFSPTTSGATTSSSHFEDFYFPRTEVGKTAGGSFTIFTTKNPPSASQVGALPLTGGTLTGSLTVNDNIYGKGTLTSQTNSYPQLTLQNASGANLAMLYSNGTNGGYSNTVLRVYSSASEYSSFSFGKDGVLEFGGVLRSGNHTIKGNSYPVLSFTDLSVTKTFAYLQPQTSAGDYADVLLAVKNSSGQSNFLFAMNGDLTIGKKLYNPGGQVVKRLGLTSSGTNGYVKFATIDLTGTTYQNQPIRIAIAQRGRYGSFKLRFASANSADPAVEQFVKTGQIEVYIHKKATSTWDLYLKKTEAYDDIDVTVYENGSHNSFKFTWVDTLVSALPSGYVTASEETWSGPAASANALNNTLSADKGGTGCSSLRAAGSAIINALDTGTAQPLDGDYYICQSAGGGTTDTEYVRRPMSALWSYIKSKGNSTYLPLTGGTLTGPLNLSGSVVITLNSKSDERQFMIRNSTNTENIYLYQTASARGIYSTCSTGSVAVLQALAGSNSWTFNGVATSANTLNNTLSIEKGGTGATTAADARTNLGITPANIGAAASSHTHSYLPLSGGTISGSIAVTGNVTSNGKSVYTAGGNVIYSSTQPTGSTGMIWLKPV